MALPAVIGVTSLVVSAYSVYQSVKAAGEAGDIAKRNADRIQEEADEMARRERFNLHREKSLIRARVAAAGIKGITPETYYKEYTKKREREIQWMSYSAEARASIVKQEGSRAKTIGYAQAAGTAVSGISAGYNWFSTYVD